MTRTSLSLIALYGICFTAVSFFVGLLLVYAYMCLAVMVQSAKTWLKLKALCLSIFETAAFTCAKLALLVVLLTRRELDNLYTGIIAFSVGLGLGLSWLLLYDATELLPEVYKLPYLVLEVATHIAEANVLVLGLLGLVPGLQAVAIVLALRAVDSVARAYYVIGCTPPEIHLVVTAIVAVIALVAVCILARRTRLRLRAVEQAEDLDFA